MVLITKKNSPPKSFIDVNDFANIEELAKYLQYLDVNDEEYLEYFQWKKDYVLYEEHPYCKLCQKLNDPKEQTKVYEDLRKWWLFDENHHAYCSEGKTRRYYNSMMQEDSNDNYRK